MNNLRAFRMSLGAGMLVLLPVTNVAAQFVTPSAAQWPTRLESPIAVPLIPGHRFETSASDVEASRRDQSAVSLVVTADDHGPSYASYALWGAGIGGGLGLAIGAFADRRDPCYDCFHPNGKILGTIVGGLFGWAIGSIAYFGSQPPTSTAR